MANVRGGNNLIPALAVSSATSVILYIISARYYGAGQLWFLNWNLLLAWVPLGVTLILVRYLSHHPWVSWPGALLTLLWLGFLPNSFYLISDLIHINYAGSGQTLYYIIMLFSFAFNGLIIGFLSVYILHKELIKRLSPLSAHTFVAIILLLCSFAVYLGRYLRWSTWDVILNPAGVLFDVSDRIINPVAYGQTFQVTAMFFILLASMYFVFWHLVRAARQDKLL